jgi:hypothetical protein
MGDGEMMRFKIVVTKDLKIGKTWNKDTKKWFRH